MNRIFRRVEALEERAGFGDDHRPWRRIIWSVGQTWDEALVASGADKLRPGSVQILLYDVIGAEDGRPMFDPVRVEERPKADAWLAAMEAGVSL
jgi:hypothetical protein